jgi:hypothetical protein
VIACKPEHLIARAKERGYTVDEVMPCVKEAADGRWLVDETHPAYPRPKPAPAAPKPPPPPGAGTALKGLLKLIGITSSPTCKCNARARAMDEMGIQWCRDNGELIAGDQGWLMEEASKRSLPYSVFAGKRLLQMAIYRGAKYPDARP